LDLAELGVLEVDDDIFENFDEENIPVIKNIYKRKKGSAEKFMTNQSNRNTFLSSQSLHNTNSLSASHHSNSNSANLNACPDATTTHNAACSGNNNNNFSKNHRNLQKTLGNSKQQHLGYNSKNYIFNSSSFNGSRGIFIYIFLNLFC